MKEFRVNEYISLKLEEGKTNIYANGKLFNQCKYILTRKKADELGSLSEIKSVDELAENLDHSLEGVEPELIDIPVETRFWVHCSNMQIWAENNYNTCFLHRNLAFPLLKKLYELGVPLAKKVFKEEIAKRIVSNYIPVITFLMENDYFLCFNEEELQTLTYDLSDNVKSCIKDIIYKKFQGAFRDTDKQNKIYEILSVFCVEAELEKIQYVIYKKNKYFVHNGSLRISGITDMNAIQKLDALKEIKRISFRNGKISEISNLNNLNMFEELDLSGNQISQIKNLEYLINLKVLNLSRNKISDIEGIENLINLEKLYISSNEIYEIKRLDNLTRLKVLHLDYNQIEKIKSLNELPNLKILWLNNNQISEIENLEKLKCLKTLLLNGNQIKEIKGIGNLKNLEWLNLGENQIVEIKGLKDLKKLEVLVLKNNEIHEIKGLMGLSKLEILDLSDNKLPDPFDNREYEKKELIKFLHSI